MERDDINLYFGKLGYDVCYNTLNNTELLRRAYVKDYQSLTDNAKDKWSQYVKNKIYSDMYDFMPREKFTGFENFKKIDRTFRKTISPLITKSQFSDTQLLSRDENTKIDISYKEALKNRVRQFKNPLLYYSGGIDSELVAMAMLDANVKFTPVIFELIGIDGAVKNIHDIHHAYNFCAKHGLYPIIKQLNLDELWASREFADLAIELQIQSPQLVTHAWMIKTMCGEYPDRSHVFGGEVRFYSNHVFDQDVPSNMILLNKAAGLDINGANILDEDAASPYGECQAQLYISNNYTGHFYEVFTATTTPYTWYTVTGTPSPTFYQAITSITVLNQDVGTSYFPTATTGYTPIGSNDLVAYSRITAGTGVGDIRVNFTLSVYGSASSGTVVSGSVTLEATHAI